MSAPLEVAVVRPYPSMKRAVSELLGQLLGALLVAWFLMLLTPLAVTSYVQCLAAVAVVHLLFGYPHDYRLWTHEGRS